MTVKELIEELSVYADNEQVFTQDLIPATVVYAGGVVYITDVKQAKDWVVE